MSGYHARYQPGEWVCASLPDRWLLADVPPDSPIVTKLWEAFSSAAAPEDVLDALLAGGVRATPSFALLWLGQVRRLYVRGHAKALVKAGGTTRTVDSDERSIWNSSEVEAGTSEVTLSGSRDSSGPELPMAAGVTIAARVAIGLTSPLPATAPQEQVPGVDDSGSTRVYGDVIADLPAQEPPVQEPAESAPDKDGDEGGVRPETDTAEDAGYDHLFGATMRPIPIVDEFLQPSGPIPALVGEVTPIPESPVNETARARTAAPNPEPYVDDLSFAGDAGLEDRPDGAGLIDAVPWLRSQSPTADFKVSSPAGPAPVPTSAELPEDRSPHRAAGEATDRTVDRRALLADLGRGAQGPTVLACRCPIGHLTPPHLPVCRVCGSQVETQQPVEVPRPSLGVLRLSTGDAVTLDRGVRIGRKPEAPPGATERPHLVRVSSPEHDVSRQHAEIVLEGWQVYVRDLGSTNGTTVALPGQAPQRLREGELQLLENGAAVVLADEIQCVFEVTS